MSVPPAQRTHQRHAAGPGSTFLITSIIFLAVRRVEILIVGLLVSFGMFLVIFILPSHLFQNPFRFHPRLKQR